MKTAYLGLGSNLGDRRAWLTQAVERLRATEGVTVRALSSVYETRPVGKTDQGDFLNLVLEIGTTLEPRALLAHCLAIETKLGRVRLERWGPRTLDIDVLWFEGESLATPELSLPHPRMTERAFVMVPLAEIAPELRLQGRSARQIAASLDASGIVTLGAL